MATGQRSLVGTRILVTRAGTGNSSLAALLAGAGAEVLELPVTRIESLDPAPLRQAVAHLADYDWLVFTSKNAVHLFREAMRAQGVEPSELGPARVGAVGASTAEALTAQGLPVHLVPEHFVAEGLLDAIRASGTLSGARVLYVCAEGARDVLPGGLREAGASVETIVAYRSVAERGDADLVRRQLQRGEIHLVTFTAASAVRAFVEAIGEQAARRAAAAVIGPITGAAAREAGLTVAVEAAESTASGLVDAIIQSRHLPR